LHSIHNGYLRNITISMIRDIIHMHFNFDGTHIASAEDYERFFRREFIKAGMHGSRCQVVWAIDKALR